MTARKTVWRLYALQPTEQNIEYAQTMRFARIKPEYILLYKSGRKPKDAICIGKDKLDSLSQSDAEWLFNCGVVLLGDTVKRNTPKTMEMLARLEAELQKQETAYRAEKGVMEDGNKQTELDI